MSLQRTGLPFGGFAVPYFEAAWKTAPNTAGQSLIANTFATLTLDTVIVNTASGTGEIFNGVIVSSNQIQNLPAGTYYFETHELCLDFTASNGDVIVQLYNASDTSVIKAGKLSYDGTTGYSGSSFISGQFKITAAKNISLRAISGAAVDVGKGSVAFTDSTAGADQRTTLKLWKIG